MPKGDEFTSGMGQEMNVGRRLIGVTHTVQSVVKYAAGADTQ